MIEHDPLQNLFDGEKEMDKRFGRLTVIKDGEPKGKDMKPTYECLCDCGNTVTVTRNRLRTGNTKSCGCLRSELMTSKNTKHGKAKSPEYNTWKHVRQRCLNPNNKKYPSYGGRGIKICDRWLESFDNFYIDMGDKPSLKHSIDRIDPNGNYEPSNCRWATATTQARNQRPKKSNKTGVIGVSFSKRTKKWIVNMRIEGKQKQLGSVIDFFEACCLRKSAEIKYYG